MVGIYLTGASHKLNIILVARPVRQKMRRFHPTHYQIIQMEVDNLLRVGFIREVKYPKWLVCVDYTDLNDACPKDSFLLLRIDQIVDAAAWHGTLSFIDAFPGYHHIPMHSLDIEKTVFITPHGLYSYNVMPFGL